MKALLVALALIAANFSIAARTRACDPAKPSSPHPNSTARLAAASGAHAAVATDEPTERIAHCLQQAGCGLGFAERSGLAHQGAAGP